MYGPSGAGTDTVSGDMQGGVSTRERHRHRIPEARGMRLAALVRSAAAPASGEEPQHLQGGIRALWIGIAARDIATRPGMPGAVDEPVLGNDAAIGGAVHRARCAAPARPVPALGTGDGVRHRAAAAQTLFDHALAVA